MNDESPLDILRRKLAELHKAEATATAAAAKFELAEQIKETKDKIRELESVEAGVSAQSASPIVAKGLRSFDQRDADFFLRLLPGPYRADGLPESIHFWKTRIEETDPSKTFRVGVMYGPSGCGKSSLLRAGLLPRLAETVIPVSIDATATDTESELLRELRKRCGFLGPGDDLASLLNRQDRIPAGCKLLLVVDQFEQWLHGRDEDGYRQLTDALRACDGEHAQCMLLIRDDFWTPLTEFLGQLQVRQVEGENTTLVNRFDRRHARKVLTLFGKSYGALPTSSELSKEQVSFVEQAVEELAEKGRVICVRLALFADMAKSWDWTPVTLRRVGGAEGVGVAFLRESLGAEDAPRPVRVHQQAAIKILTALLPEQGADIKGSRRSWSELIEKSGYAGHTDRFSHVVDILDKQLRLITPIDVEPEDETPRGGEVAPEKFCQLTHDYLVESLRKWLAEKQTETWQGRAALRLQEYSQLWNRKQEDRFLPGLPQYATIWLGTKASERTDTQNRMIRRASGYYGVRAGVVLLLAFALVFGVREVIGYRRAESFVTNRILDDTLKPQAVSDLLPQAASFGRWAVPALQSELDARKSSDTPQGRHRIYRRQSNVLLVMSHLGQTDKLWEMLHFDPTIPGDPTRRSYVIARYADSGGDPNPLLAQLDKEKNASIRQALLLMLGDFKQEQLPADNFASKVVGIFRDDPDPGVHSAAEWLLRQWKNHDQEWQSAVQQLATGAAQEDRQWYLTKPIAGPKDADVEPAPPLTMVILDAKQFTMGSPTTEQGRSDDERQHTRTINRKFAIATTEVTNAQFRRALLDEKFVKSVGLRADDLKEFLDNDRPAADVSWYMAAAYCNWLSDQAGLEKCYEPFKVDEKAKLEKFEGVMRVKQEFLTLNGYRLPTEAEWEYACRAGAETAYSFGDAEELLALYAWYNLKSEKQSHPVSRLRPNGFGLFDMHGNLEEWCNTRWDPYPDIGGNDAETGGWVSGDSVGRVFRGGSFAHFASRVRGASRYSDDARYRYLNGFRVARTYR